MKDLMKILIPSRWRTRLRAFQWRIEEIWAPSKALQAFPLYWKFQRDLRHYASLPGAEKIESTNLWPCIFDNTKTSPVPAHYFYQAAWAARRIKLIMPSQHIDIGSQLDFVGIFSSSIPFIFLDIRPLIVHISNLNNIVGSVLELPFKDNSIASMSCLHVIEHIGLGRYGDPFDPLGTKKAVRELIRVLRPDGNLFFSLPIGRERLCFNAHRIHSPKTVLEYFKTLKLVEFSCEDGGKFHENVDPERFETASYACGLFWFSKAY